MSSQIAITSLYDQLIASFDPAVSGDAALDRVKKDAFAAFQKNGFPSAKNEYWRFTNVRPFVQDDFGAAPSANVDFAALKPYEAEADFDGLDAYKLVLVNGKINFEHSSLPDSDKIAIQPVSAVKNSEFFLSAINKNLDLRDAGNAFSALNTALFEDGYSIEIKEGVTLDKPLHIYQLFAADGNVFLNTRNIVWVNKGANLELIETADCIGISKYFINTVTDVTVATEGFLRHTVIQDGNAGERWVSHTQVDQAENSRYENYIFSFPSAELIRNDLNVELNGTYTETHMYGLYLVGKDQLIDNHSLVGHRSPHCESNQLYKGVMLENGKGVFNGRIYVHPDAQKTNAYQSSKNMLFSNEANVHAKPQLEIYADDVKCSHGTTIGQFDPEMVFYLQSRGIAEQEAKAMLVNAFAYDVSSKIPNEVLRDYVEELVRKAISSADTE